MFHVYFGAFDFLVYAIAAVFAIYLADAICNEMEEGSGLESLEVNQASLAQLVQTSEDKPLVLNGQIFELRGTLVIKQADIPGSLPDGIKVLSLRGDPVIRLSDLQDAYETVAIDIVQVIRKWEQWNQQKRNKRSEAKKRKAPTEAASLNGGTLHGIATC